MPEPTVFPFETHVKNVRVNNGGEVANNVAPGSTVTVVFDWSIQAGPPCPGSCDGCLQQIFVGLAGMYMKDCNVHTLRKCPGASGTNATASFVAPVDPGVYYISVGSTWNYHCYDGGTPSIDPGAYVGAICVK